MSNAAKTVLGYSFYALALGGSLIVVPNLVLVTFGFPPTKEGIIRVAGMLFFLMGFIHLRTAFSNIITLIELGVYLRYAASVMMASFFVLNFIGKGILLLSGIDFATATLTALALRSDRKADVAIRRQSD
ncbi:MAG TPA: hypothetical protein VI756_20885 [Blastocatellia bacterium]